MSAKTIRITYWILLTLLSLAMLADGFGGVTQQKDGQDVLRHLGYPMYALIIFGIAKILAAIALLQTKFKTIKEWAYAGFTINCVGAVMSRAFAGDGVEDMIPPIVLLIFILATYYFWKQYEATKSKITINN